MNRYCLALLLIVMFLLPCRHGFAQSKEIDSLLHRLEQKHLADSDRMETLLQLGWDMSFFDGAAARSYLDSCIQIARKSKNNLKIGSALAYLGSSFFNEGRFDSALHYYQRAEPYFLKDPSPEGSENVIVNRMSMGTVALQQNQYEEALKHYFNVIDYFEHSESVDWANLLTAYANIGLVYNDMRQYGRALEYHQKALALFEEHPTDVKKKASILMLIALDQLNLELNTEFLRTMQRAEALLNELGSPFLHASFYALKGRYFNDVRDYRQAITFSKRAMEYARQGPYEFETGNILFQLGRSHLGLAQPRISLQYLLPGLDIHRKLKDKTRERAALERIAQAYLQLGNYEQAAHFFQDYSRLSDSLNASEIQEKINETENRFQNKQKADSILVLRKSAELQQLALNAKKAQNTFIIIASVLLLLAALLLYRHLQNRHRLLKQSERLHQQQIQQLEKERQLVATQSLMKGQEEERSRLAKDLHDGVGGLLSGVKLSLSNMKGNVFLSEKNAQAVSTIIEQLDHSIGELRRVSHNMMPEALIRFGLKEALENYCENIDRAGGLRVRLQTFGLEKRMEQDSEIILYRILQELLNNVIKHSEASQALVQIVREQDRFTLTVEDNGRGFHPDELAGKQGAGLQNIQARARYLNGTVDIRSRPGEGTSITIEGTTH